MGGALKGIGGAVGGVSNSVNLVTRGMNISPVIQSALKSIAESGDQRAAFNAILLASAANAQKKPHFNLELEINDLFIRLGNLRGMQASSGTGTTGGPLKGLANGIESILGPLDNAIQALAKTAKP